jgi:hypothetical protein
MSNYHFHRDIAGEFIRLFQYFDYRIANRKQAAPANVMLFPCKYYSPMYLITQITKAVMQRTHGLNF